MLGSTQHISFINTVCPRRLASHIASFNHYHDIMPGLLTTPRELDSAAKARQHAMYEGGEQICFQTIVY